MAEEGLQVSQIHDDFYRDSFGKVIFIIASIALAIVFTIALSLYLYYEKPAPVVFKVDSDWRVKPEVAIDQPYLTNAELLQWIGEVMPRLFVLDFYHYNDQVQAFNQYFTENGWKVFLNQLNIYANYDTVQKNKLFLFGQPASAPYITNQGLLNARYAWLVKMPVTINFVGITRTMKQTLSLEITIVRVSTLNNLSGVAIDNIIVTDKTVGGDIF